MVGGGNFNLSPIMEQHSTALRQSHAEACGPLGAVVSTVNGKGEGKRESEKAELPAGATARVTEEGQQVWRGDRGRQVQRPSVLQLKVSCGSRARGREREWSAQEDNCEGSVGAGEGTGVAERKRRTTGDFVGKMQGALLAVRSSQRRPRTWAEGQNWEKRR